MEFKKTAFQQLKVRVSIKISNLAIFPGRSIEDFIRLAEIPHQLPVIHGFTNVNAIYINLISPSVDHLSRYTLIYQRVAMYLREDGERSTQQEDNHVISVHNIFGHRFAGLYLNGITETVPLI